MRKLHRQSEFVERIVGLGTATLQAHLETHEEEAKVAMREVAHKICQEFGGSELYVPKDREWELQARDRQLAADHAREEISLRELGQRYKISTRQVSIILKHVREQTAAAARLVRVVNQRKNWPFPKNCRQDGDV